MAAAAAESPSTSKLGRKEMGMMPTAIAPFHHKYNQKCIGRNLRIGPSCKGSG